MDFEEYLEYIRAHLDEFINEQRIAFIDEDDRAKFTGMYRKRNKDLIDHDEIHGLHTSFYYLEDMRLCIT